MEEKDFEKKPKKKVGLIITVVVLVLVAIIAIGWFAYLKLVKNKPQAIFEKAISKAFEMVEINSEKEGKLDIEISASLNSQQQDMMMANTYLQMLKLKLTTEFNMNKKVLNQGISVLAFEEPVISVEGLIQEDNIYFLLNNIYSKYIQVPSEELEGIEPREIFNTENIEVSAEITKELKQILLDEVNSKELKQEDVEVNGKKLTKTSLRLTAEEIEQIVKKLTVELYKANPGEDVKNIVEELDQIEVENDQNYLEVSIYTKKLTGKIVKTEVAMINTIDDEAIVATITEKEDDKIEIIFAMNEESTSIDKATTISTLTIKEESKYKGTMTVKVNIDEASSVILTAKYNIDYNAKVEPKDVRNSINANDLTEEDMNEMKTNIENNEFLYSIIQSFVAPEGLFEDVEGEFKSDSIDNYDDFDYTNFDNNDLYDNDLVNNYSEATINNI